jgi:hypothetical protein
VMSARQVSPFRRTAGGITDCAYWVWTPSRYQTYR